MFLHLAFWPYPRVTPAQLVHFELPTQLYWLWFCLGGI